MPPSPISPTYNKGVEKTFYIETFGCQMNAHDSEKVVGVLLEKGYREVPEPEDASLRLLQHLQHPRSRGAEGVSPAQHVQETVR